MKAVIGITGVKQSGKTTTYNFAARKYSSLKEFALADKLKNVCSEIFNIPRENLDLPEKKEVPLDIPIYLNEEHLSKLYTIYNCQFTLEEHVKPYMNVVLSTPREIAQYVGSEILREWGPDIHCEVVYRDMLLEDNRDKIGVVTDIRFPNEYDFFRDKFGDLFFPFYIKNIKAELKATSDPHISEKFVLEIGKKCSIIDNNGTLGELEKQILAYTAKILDELKFK